MTAHEARALGLGCIRGFLFALPLALALWGLAGGSVWMWAREVLP